MVLVPSITEIQITGVERRHRVRCIETTKENEETISVKHQRLLSQVKVKTFFLKRKKKEEEREKKSECLNKLPICRLEI